MSKYEYLGSERVPRCTPPGMTAEQLLSNKTCREINNCTKECAPKTLLCPKCNNPTSVLQEYKNTKTGEILRLCYECSENLD